jgi:alpha-L-rhamnosidase
MAPDPQKTRRELLKQASATIAGATISCVTGSGVTGSGATLAEIMLAPISPASAQGSPTGETHPPGNPYHNRRFSIADFGATAGSSTVNTAKIQAAIDYVAANHVAANRSGTVVIPAGEFLTGALFLKPGVHLHLDKGAILKGSTDRAHYPTHRTRIEGHFEDWVPALINADRCDHLSITGEGTLDGSGAPFWQEFRTRYAADPKTKNLDVPRPRLALIENARNVEIRSITFRNSAFWNLHLYRCQDLLVENVRFEVPDSERCPSTDGTDIDSCQRITIRGCTYRVDDDCICLKGSKGPFALQDKDSPPVEHIRVENCTFERGHGVVTLGSEATVIRNVVVDHCNVPGPIPIVRLKLRPDTPQLYEDIHYRDITLGGNRTASTSTPIYDNPTAEIFDVRPWKQYFDLKGQPPPKSTVRNVTLTNVRGSYGSFGEIAGNPGQTTLSGFHLENIHVQLHDDKLKTNNVTHITLENVAINGRPFNRNRP